MDSLLTRRIAIRSMLLSGVAALAGACSRGPYGSARPARSKSSLILQDIAQAFGPWRELHRRDAWRPIVEDRAGQITESKFGGVPYLHPNEAWPLCAGCRRPLQFFLQLNMSSLPESSPAHSDRGLLQLFYCTSSDWRNFICPAEDQSYLPFSQGKVVRTMEPTPETATTAVPPGLTPFPCRLIVGWERFDDYPAPSEHEELGLDYDYEFNGLAATTLVTVQWKEQGVRFDKIRDPDESPGVAESIGSAEEKDKLGGWPRWVQGVEYPNCPRCGKRMEYLFQLDSEDHVPYMFGDVGCGHITRCRDHRDVLGFGWACS